MTQSNNRAYIKKERLAGTALGTAKRDIDLQALTKQAERLRQVLMDPNQAPVMEVFIEVISKG
jgi:hypothetical protein